MVKRLVLIDVGPGETRIAHLEDGRLAELAYARAPADVAPGTGASAQVGDILLGRVKRILPGMDAAFVDIGEMRNGFLSAKHAAGRDGEGAEAPPDIRKLVQEGQSVIVQVIKDPIGEKGARLSLSVSLPGRSLILLPGQAARALSRRIEDEQDRARLVEILGRIADAQSARAGFTVGFIARTAALIASEAQLAAEAEVLVNRWTKIAEAGQRLRAPAMLAREASALTALLRDHVDNETEAVIVNDAATFLAAQEDALKLCATLPARLKLYRDPAPLFEAYDIAGEIEALERREAALPSGGWITFEPTEALTAIDVNSGRFAANCLEETGFTTNLEAAAEIGRQLRLRGIGGLIIVDFIHMADPAHITAVEDALREALARDRTPAQMTSLSVFGVIEITRKRVREPFARLLQDACPSCHGRGTVASIAAIANDALRALAQESARRPAGPGLRLRLAPEAAAWLTARQESVLAPLAARLSRPVAVEADTGLLPDHYCIEEVGS